MLLWRWLDIHGAVQDPDKFMEQTDQEQQELRRRLEGATERVRSIQACPLLPHLRTMPNGLSRSRSVLGLCQLRRSTEMHQALEAGASFKDASPPSVTPAIIMHHTGRSCALNTAVTSASRPASTAVLACCHSAC